ncbi:KATNB1-like protein 1 isoform X2 [Spea bombifrons]|uniref:KATNB1-like protein 1 isoform X2 n=1 Tax=Spea bombifrons TaxID=233779 RepID=UPI00234BDE75|nr:KATNB1-like protein 1 isoform X2 [Spea bombifrons]
MASGASDSKKRDLEEGSGNDFPRKRISPSAKQNMKEGKKLSSEELVCVGNRTLVVAPSISSQKLFNVIYCKRKARQHTESPTYRKKHLPKGWGSDMANKENELAAGNLQNEHHTVLNSSDSSSSQTEGPSSKYSGFFSEVSKDHETMAQVLFSRNLRLNVALTFWRKRSVNELVAYLVRMQDLGVVADCLPVLTNRLQEDNASVSAGCCVDLLPLVKSLLKSKYEEYVIVGLNWLQAIVKRWWTQLISNSDNSSDENLLILKHQMTGIWKQESHLTSFPGYTGKIAKDLDGYLVQLR